MSSTFVLFGILGALLLGAMSPGPSFVLVCRTAIAISRRDGLAAAVGMGLGATLLGGLALLGLHALLLHAGWLYPMLKILGGAYLLYLGIRIWRGASQPLVMADDIRIESGSSLRSFAVSFATQISNPKTIVVYGGIFAALLPEAPPLWMILILPPLIFAVETGWYAIVALIFSADVPRSAYARSKSWIDRAASAVMGALGLRLVVEAIESRS